MQSNDFHILVLRDQVRLSWGDNQETPFPLATGLEKDRLIAHILQKVLNMYFVADEVEVFGIAEFQVLGTTLFNLLFNDDELKIRFKTFYKEALGSTDQRHRLILEFDRSASDMAVLPWEYLYYEEDEAPQAFLAAHLKKCMDVVRKLQFPGNWLEYDKAKQHIEPPLRVLVIVTNDGKDDFGDIVAATTTYFNKLKTQHDALIDYRFIIDPDVNTFSDQLEAIVADNDATPFYPHIIHFIGHSRMYGDVGQICLPQKQNGDTYLENWINEDTFANYFEILKHPPHLFFLHVPEGVPFGDFAADKGIVLKLVKRGIPFAIAFQNPVPIWMVQHFMETFYEHLLEGQDLAYALTECRIELARKSKDSKGLKYDDYAHKVFGSPVLYASVNKTFALASTKAESEKMPIAENYKVCAEHPDKRFALSDNWCTFCGKKLLLPSELTQSAPASAKTTTPKRGAADRPQRSSAGSSNSESINAGAQRGEETSIFIETSRTTVTIESIANTERQGWEKQLDLWIRKKIFLESERAKINDTSQKFELDLEIEEAAQKINELKQRLGLSA